MSSAEPSNQAVGDRAAAEAAGLSQAWASLTRPAPPPSCLYRGPVALLALALLFPAMREPRSGLFGGIASHLSSHEEDSSREITGWG